MARTVVQHPLMPLHPRQQQGQQEEQQQGQQQQQQQEEEEEGKAAVPGAPEKVRRQDHHPELAQAFGVLAPKPLTSTLTQAPLGRVQGGRCSGR